MRDNPNAICDDNIQIPRLLLGLTAARNTAPLAPPIPLIDKRMPRPFSPIPNILANSGAKTCINTIPNKKKHAAIITTARISFLDHENRNPSINSAKTYWIVFLFSPSLFITSCE